MTTVTTEWSLLSKMRMCCCSKGMLADFLCPTTSGLPPSCVRQCSRGAVRAVGTGMGFPTAKLSKRARATIPAAGHWGQPGAKGVPSTLPYPAPVPQHMEHFGRQEGQEIKNLWPKPVRRLLPAVNLPHTETPLSPKLQQHHIPSIPTAAQPPPRSKQHPSSQAPTGTAPAPLCTPRHRSSSAAPLLQRAEHQHPDLGSGRGTQG